ncbi:hypothetical protein L1987_78347 [Smallanthus sonchifolius]|uniref:Uncharacterized protein n=1 Tax=Smallanthus sonchifolius TaxID=185202 RepID=A0ACB8ZDH1_9ASTR|nr:hypothetical protein L1987_78347 [Smallanthus sonchifolius]
MSGGRVSIPNNVRKMIQNLKEITGSHSEDEIYAMLKECSMDPNETAQKFLLQDPFHEVKRKRDRKKENLNKESTELRWKPGMQGRGNRGGRLNYSSRHISISNDAVGGRTSVSAKENGVGKGVVDGQSRPIRSSSRAVNINIVPAAHISVGSDKKSEVGPTVGVRSGIADGPLISSPNTTPASKAPPSPPGVYLSDSDPILVPSHDSLLPVGTIRRESKSQPNPVEQIHETPLEIKSTASVSTVGISSMQGKAPVTHVSFSTSRPSSSYNNRAQQTIGPQKVGPSMEWKPKQTNPTLSQGTKSSESIKMPTVPVESQTSNLSAAGDSSLKDTTDGLVKKLEEATISDDQHVCNGGDWAGGEGAGGVWAVGDEGGVCGGVWAVGDGICGGVWVVGDGICGGVWAAGKEVETGG